MDRRNKNYEQGLRQAICLLVAILIGGCTEQKRVCPPITTMQEAATVLQEYSAGLKPLKATGNCTISYTNEKGERFAQSFPVRIWFENKNKFCLYGDVMFDPRAISFVVTGDKYWTYAKPFGIYVNGQVDMVSEDYFSNPTVLVDFLEPLGDDCGNVYMAKAEKNFNVVMCRDKEFCKTKKIFMERCSRLVKKIEYFNCAGNVMLVVEADDYRSIAGGGRVLFPHKLVYKYAQGQKNNNTMQIKLDSVRSWQSTTEQLKALFTPPDANAIRR